MKVVQVAAGLICHEGRYLIAKRQEHVHLGGLWEFPGGKREAGETLEACLQRELSEELCIRIGAPRLFQIIRHDYHDQVVELHFFHCTIESGQPTAVGCSEIKWVFPRELDQFEFPPADRPVITALQQQHAGSPT